MTFTTDIAAVAPECLFTPSYAAADYVPTQQPEGADVEGRGQRPHGADGRVGLRP